MYKGAKYNIMLVFLIFVIGVFLGATSIFSNITDVGLNPVPDTEVDAGIDEGQNEMPTGKFSPPSASASPHTRIAFAFKVLKEGEGFMANISQTIVSMGQVQNVFSKSYRDGKQDLSEEWLWSATAFAKTEFVSKYSNGETVKVNTITDKSKFSGPSKTYQQSFANKKEQFSVNDFVARVGNFNDFPLTINSQTVNVSRYDKMTDRNNYVINVNFKTSMIDSTYLKLYEENGTKGISFKEITITFRINKKTGFFSSISKTEKFSATYAGIPVNCDATMTLTFLKVNTSMKSEIDAKVSSNFK